MSDWLEIFHKYSSQVGSDYIASPKALRIIQKEVDKFVKKNRKEETLIIEIGTGIGTIAELITTRVPKVKYFAFERDEYCIEKMKTNLLPKSVTLFTDLNLLNTAIKEDDSRACFLIVDDFINEFETNSLVQNLKNKSLVVIIEGHRFRQRIFFTSSLLSLDINFTARFFGNSRDSVKGAFYLKSIDHGSIINKAAMKIICRILFARLTIQSNLYSRKILQYFGIRKRTILNYLPRLSKRS